MSIEAVQEIKDRINKNLDMLYKLDEKYLNAYRPKGCPEGTSYNDYDTIHAGKKEPRIEDYYSKRQRILAMIDLDEQLLISISMQIDAKEYVKLLKNNHQKVKYYRFVKGYKQEEAATIIGISVRQLQRIEKELKMSSLMSCTVDFQ